MIDPDDNLNDKIAALTKSLSSANDDEGLADIYIERAHCYSLRSDHVNAVNGFLSALERTKDKKKLAHIKAMISLAFATKHDRKEQALFWAMGAVDQDPSSAEAHHVLGLACDLCGFLNLAIESFQRALQLEPDRWDTLRALGRCLRENCQLEEAIESLRAYVANNPDEPFGLFELGWTYHVCVFMHDHVRRAREMYQTALKNNPTERLRATIERKLADIQGKKP